jgi:hypothetical protein
MLFTVHGPSTTKWSRAESSESKDSVPTLAERAEAVHELKRKAAAAELKARQALLAAKARKRCGSWDPNRAASGSDAYALRAVQRK